MALSVERLRPDQEEEYDRYLLTHGHSLVYYSSKYKRLLKELLGCKEQYLIAVEGDRIRGVMPLLYVEAESGRVYNSLPYYGSNGGIIADSHDAYQILADSYNEIAGSRTTISSTVVANPFTEQEDICLRHNLADQRIGQFTALQHKGQSGDHTMSLVESSARRNVSKATRLGVRVALDHARIDSLRMMHQENIRAMGGMPKSDRFFDLVAKHMTPEEDVGVYVATKDDEVVAALMVLYFNRTAEYFVPAVKSEHRSAQPLSLILMTAISDASRRGLSWWNWGGTWASQTGVYRFKRKWAAQERVYSYRTQLNDESLLDRTESSILTAFPNFYVVPFSALKKPNAEVYTDGAPLETRGKR